MKREGLLAGLFALFAVALVVGVFVYLMVVRTPFTTPLGNPQTAGNAGATKTQQSPATPPATAGGPTVASPPAPSAAAQAASAATGLLTSGAAPPATARPDQNRSDPNRAAPPPSAGAGKVNVSNPPSFDIVRVEPSGSAVLAGQSDPGGKIEIMDGDKVIATAKANQRGEWVASLDKPLAPGTHDLALRTTASDQATQTISDQRVAVQVPERGSTDVLVVASAPNAPSRIIAAPPASAAAGRPAGTTPPAPQGQPDPGGQAANEPDRNAAPAAAGDPTTTPPAAGGRPGAGPGGPIETAVNTPSPERQTAGAPAPGGAQAAANGASPPPTTGDRLLAEAGAGGNPPGGNPTREFAAPQTRETAGGAAAAATAGQQSGTPPATGKADPRVQTAGTDGAGQTVVPPSTDGKPATVEAAAGAVTPPSALAPAAAAVPTAAETAAAGPPPAPAKAGEGASQKVLAEAVPDRRPTVFATVPVGGGPQILSTAQSGNTAGGVSIIRGGAIGTAVPPSASAQRSAAAILSLAPPPATGDEIRGAPTTLTGIAGAERTGAIPGAKARAAADVQVANAQPLAGREAAPVSAPALSVEAVEADTDGKLFIAGSAAAVDPVRIYFDDAFLGEVQPKRGRWLLETTRQLAPGQYAVRADQVSGTTGSVIARAEVPFEREADVAILRPVGAAGSPLGAVATGTLADPQTVIIRRGDNLWTISRRLYGDGSRYSTIYQANTDQIRNPHWIYPGQIFVVPAGETVRKN